MITDKDSLLFETERLFLRPLTAQDVTDAHVSGLNDPEVHRYLVEVKKSRQTRASVEAFVNANQKDPASILFGIFPKIHPEKAIGTVRVTDVEFFNYTAVIGVCLFIKDEWKKGYALEALKRIKSYLFDILGLHYLEAGVYAANDYSLRLFREAGFGSHCIMRNKFRLDDHFEDVIYFAAFNPGFDVTGLRSRPPVKED